MIETGYRSALTELLAHGELDPEVRMLAARGVLAPRAHEQVALLMLLSADADEAIAAAASATLSRLPLAPLRAFLARPDVPDAMRAFFAGRGIAPAADAPSHHGDPLIDADAAASAAAVSTAAAPPAAPPAAAGADTADEPDDRQPLSALPIVERMKLAFKGTREQRGQLIRDSNRMVAAAVLSSPKLNESEVEAYAKMGNVSEEVLRTIGTNRTWLKNYNITLAVTRNPKTPPGISMQLLRRLNDRDVKAVVKDRNVPEALRLAARRMVTGAQA